MKNKSLLYRPAQRRTIALPLTVSLALAGAAFGQSNWTNTTTFGDQSWNLAGNWNPSGVPSGTGVTVNFTSDIAAIQRILLGGSKTVGTLNMGDANGADGFVIKFTANETLTFDATGSGPAALNHASSSAGIDQINCTVILSDDLVITTNNTGGGFNIGGAITGAKTVTLNAVAGTGADKLTFGGNNSYSKLVVNANATFNNSPKVPDSGSDTAFGAVPSSFTADAITLNGGSLRLAGDFGVTIAANRGITLGSGGGTLMMNGASSSWVVNSSISGSSGGGLAVTGAGGTTTLNATNSYNGATTVQQGTLKLGASGSIASSPVISVASGATLDVSAVTGGVWTVGASQTLKGAGRVLASTAVNQGVAFAANAVHAPGNSIGIQTITGNVTYNSNSIFEWEMNYAAGNEGLRGTNYDAVNVSGNVNGNNSIFEIVLPGSTTFADSFWDSSRNWDKIFTVADATTPIANWTSKFTSFAYYNLAGGIKTSISAPTVADGSFTFTDGTKLTWTAVPEPTSALAGLLITAGLLRRRRA